MLPDLFALGGKVALVSGSSQGLARALHFLEGGTGLR